MNADLLSIYGLAPGQEPESSEYDSLDDEMLAEEMAHEAGLYDYGYDSYDDDDDDSIGDLVGGEDEEAMYGYGGVYSAYDVIDPPMHASTSAQAGPAIPDIGRPRTYEEMLSAAGKDTARLYGLTSFEIEELLQHFDIPPVLTWKDEIEGNLAFLMLLRFLRAGQGGLEALKTSGFGRPMEELSLAVFTTMTLLLNDWRHLIDLFNAQRYYLTPQNIEMLTWQGDGKNENVVPKTHHASAYLPFGARRGNMVWGFLAPRSGRWLTMPDKSAPAATPRSAEFTTICTTSGLLYLAGPLPDLWPDRSVGHVTSWKKPVQDWLLRNSTTDPAKAAKNNEREKPPHPNHGGGSGCKRAYIWGDSYRDHYGHIIGEVPSDHAWRRFLMPDCGSIGSLSQVLGNGAVAEVFPITKSGAYVAGRNSKVLLSDFLQIAVLLFNCKVCISGNRHVAQFKRPAPSLHEYLLPKHSDHTEKKLPTSYPYHAYDDEY